MSASPLVSVTNQPLVTKRPMAMVQRISLFCREVVERPSMAAVELLLSRMTRLSEGQLVDNRYFGSTMLTLDIHQLEALVRDSCDVATALRLAHLWSETPSVGDRIAKLALAEACQRANAPLQATGLDHRIRAEGSWLFIDIDVEAERDSVCLRRTAR